MTQHNGKKVFSDFAQVSVYAPLSIHPSELVLAPGAKYMVILFPHSCLLPLARLFIMLLFRCIVAELIVFVAPASSECTSGCIQCKGLNFSNDMCTL